MKASKLQGYFYGLKFENQFLTSKGQAFEELFKTVMKYRFGSDFSYVKPYGNIGDRKMDGYLRSEKIVYQCYAPERMDQSKLLKKVTEDFKGAIEHWRDDMKRWRLVHNEMGGLPPDALKKFLQLEKSNGEVVVDELRYEEFRSIVLELEVDQLEEVFGIVPTAQSLDNLNTKELSKVISSISQKKPPAKPILSIPTKEKLSRNQLSEDAAGMIELGRVRSKLVEQYFSEHVNPDLGQSIGSSFKEQYLNLKQENRTANQIFRELQEFAGGSGGSVERQAAVLAILTYFFETCDIFENPSSFVQQMKSEKKIDTSV